LQIYLKFVSGIAQDTEKYVPLNISANQPFVLNFSGEMYLYSGGYIMATAYTSQVPVTFAVNTFGVEVAANA
jgi:hypothetical protein